MPPGQALTSLSTPFSTKATETLEDILRTSSVLEEAIGGELPHPLGEFGIGVLEVDGDRFLLLQFKG
ncbi:hypothetical protein ACFQGT_01750 [Natrialbaceae archaeon GCM10025810]|uniref:hypothetical protein n=1 Tax=Halovalidus salilacus TaxID=3075124 RepID=UPI003622140D